jgi:hypothetical protein
VIVLPSVVIIVVDASLCITVAALTRIELLAGSVVSQQEAVGS